ncbi:MAG: hypothetical protein IJ088_10410 [Clostridia bacterium]|nr:hypothetical protein [Clostridia bacterium]
MGIIRKRASLAALVTVILAMLAAPYLTSIDPDSRVFRSSVYPTILFIAAFFPVRQVYEKQSGRALLYGMLFGLIFSFFLGIGSELTVYGAFLPGMGSLIRRFAVPVMTAPFLGALFSCLLSLSPAKETERGKLVFHFLPCFAVITVCYVLVLLAYFPGIVNYDFFTELLQYQRGPYFGAHPVFHTILTGVLFSLGNSLTGSYTLGALMYCVFQLLVMAVVYAYVVCFVSKRVPRWAACLTLLFFTLFPVHGLMAISTVKDAMFAAMLTLLVTEIWQAQEDPEGLMASWRRQAGIVLTCLSLSLLRHNGVFSYVFACIALLLICRRKRALVLVAVTLVVSLAIPKAIRVAVRAWDTPDSEMMSIPCQQLMRTANRAPMSDEERAELSTWWVEGTVERYHPYYADTAKGGNFNYERYKADKGAFWQTWLRYGRRYPVVYLEAFLMNCAGIWNPDDISHAHSMDSEGWDFVYTKTEIIFPEEAGTLEQRPILPRLHRFLQGIAHSSRHERIPFVALLFRPSIHVYALLLLAFMSRVRRSGTGLVLLPIWGIVLSYVFSACILVRYAYSFMACVPVAFILILCCGQRQEVKKPGV